MNTEAVEGQVLIGAVYLPPFVLCQPLAGEASEFLPPQTVNWHPGGET